MWKIILDYPITSIVIYQEHPITNKHVRLLLYEEQGFTIQKITSMIIQRLYPLALELVGTGIVRHLAVLQIKWN